MRSGYRSTWILPLNKLKFWEITIFIFTMRMHSSKMGIVHCSGHLSCHKRMPPPCHTCPLPCMPPAMHTPPPHTPPGTHMSPCHACPLPCIPPLPCMLSPPHVPPAMHDPLPRMLPPPTPPWTEFLTHTCENITFPQLLLQTVLTC